MNKSDLIPIICQEECAEVIQAISKVFRFGLHQTNVVTLKTNKLELEVEIGQLMCMLDKLGDAWDLDGNKIARAYFAKEETFDKWNDYFDRKPNENTT